MLMSTDQGHVRVLYFLLHFIKGAIELHLSPCKEYSVIRSSHSLSSKIHNALMFPSFRYLQKTCISWGKKTILVKYLEYKKIFWKALNSISMFYKSQKYFVCKQKNGMCRPKITSISGTVRVIESIESLVKQWIIYYCKYMCNITEKFYSFIYLICQWKC